MYQLCESVYHWLNANSHVSCWQIDAVPAPVSTRITTSTVSVWVLFPFMSSALFLSQIPLQTLACAQTQTWVLSCCYLRRCFIFYCLGSLVWVNSILLISFFPKSSSWFLTHESCFGPTATLLWISNYDSWTNKETLQIRSDEVFLDLEPIIAQKLTHFFLFMSSVGRSLSSYSQIFVQLWCSYRSF